MNIQKNCNWPSFTFCSEFLVSFKKWWFEFILIDHLKKKIEEIVAMSHNQADDFDYYTTIESTPLLNETFMSQVGAI